MVIGSIAYRNTVSFRVQLLFCAVNDLGLGAICNEIRIARFERGQFSDSGAVCDATANPIGFGKRLAPLPSHGSAVLACPQRRK